MSVRPLDNFDAYFADKLWRLMPAIHRTLDTDQYGANGPLREMVNRIGASAAELKRGSDRQLDDYSIETCDDWVIAYLADLLGTRLVYGLDSAGQRRDVANTIAYRRRKGTLGAIEQIARDVSLWDVKAVEFFRRLARTRHGLDPPIGMANRQPDASLAEAEGLVGQTTRTPLGGFADLRDVAGSRLAHTAYDEFFHTAEMRAGHGRAGWYSIPRLGLFVWRLKSYVVKGVTPVRIAASNWFCFDPTGRDIALFCRSREGTIAVDAWTSPGPTDVAAAITKTVLEESMITPIVAAGGQSGSHLQTKDWGDRIAALPNTGDLFTIDGVEAADPQTGFPTGSPQQFAVAAQVTVGREGAAALTLSPAISVGIGGTVAGTPPAGAALRFLARKTASLYGEVKAGASIEVDAPDLVPLSSKQLRPGCGQFQYTGASPDLAGCYTYGFASDIGAGPYDRNGQETTISTPAPKATVERGEAKIGAQLIAGTIEIGDSSTYAVDPVEVHGALTIKSLNATRPLLRLEPGETWVIRGIAPDASLTLDGLFVSGGDVILTGAFTSVVITCSTFDPGELAEIGSPPTGTYRMSADGRPLVATRLIVEASIASLVIDRCVLGPITARDYDAAVDPSSAAPRADAPAKGSVETTTISNSIVQALHPPPNASPPISSPPISSPPISSPPSSPPSASPPSPPKDPADIPAIAFADGVLNLSRCTVLGHLTAHRLTASECILHDAILVEDQQDGCLRFSAITASGVTPRAYECVLIRDRAPIFVSTRFGDPAYGQLRADADRQCLSGASMLTTQQTTILAGASDGSEMGAYARDKNPIRARAVLVKMQEYMPAGLVPVVVNVT